MRVLTVISTVFILPSVSVGAYGTNFIDMRPDPQWGTATRSAGR